MNELWDIATVVVAKARAMFLGERFLWSILSLAGFVVLVELLTNRRWRRYLTRTFVTDLCYFMFFAAGLFYFFLAGPAERFIRGLVVQHAPFLLLDVYGFLPVLPKAIVFIMTIDFFEYWAHRLGHANKLYWRFHCIHHSPEVLTPLSKFRIHWMDMLVFAAAKVVPLMILGHMGAIWMPYLPLMFLQVLSHFDIDFHYGPVLGKLLVSPRYHRIHHSADPDQYSKNYGIIFSCWDYLFGTAAKDLSRPKAYGCPDVKIPNSFVGQFFFPFLLLVRGLRWGAGRDARPAEVAR